MAHMDRRSVSEARTAGRGSRTCVALLAHFAADAVCVLCHEVGGALVALGTCVAWVASCTTRWQAGLATATN